MCDSYNSEILERFHFQEETKVKCSALRQTISGCSKNPKMGEKTASQEKISF